MDRRAAIALGLAVCGLALLAALWASTGVRPETGTGTRRSAAPAPKAPRPTDPRVRVALPPPADIERPEPPDEPPEPAAITGEDRRLMNFAVDAVLTASRTECLSPWLAERGETEPEEVVFDAVLYDGRLVDVGIRSMRLSLPPEVIQCVADRAWYADWPEWDLPGELRLQRSIQVKPRAEALP